MVRFFKRLFWILMPIALFVLWFKWRWTVWPGYHRFVYTTQHYEGLKDSLSNHQRSLYALYDSVPLAKDSCVMLVDSTLSRIVVDQIFPFWYSTRYNFYGDTETPGKGRIACGYFVSTVLRDAGLPINRIKLAVMGSEDMIRRIVKEKYIKRFKQTSYEDFIKTLTDWGDGLYIVGLDTHTGFLVCRQGKVDFVHASGRFPQCVVREPALKSITLSNSKYRVLGKLSGNPELAKKWLSGGKVLDTGG